MREAEVDEEPDYPINLPSGAVVDVTVNRVEPWEKFPSGWHYALHYGTRDGDMDLTRVTRDTTIDLINAIAEHEPGSIRETARLVDRSPIGVKKNLDELERIGLVRLEEECGAKRPLVWYDKLDLEVPVPA